MTPVPEPRSRRAHTDPRDTFDVPHIVIAAHLVERGHEMLHVWFNPSTRKPLFVFRKSAQADAERLNRTTDELASIRERASQARFASTYYHASTQENTNDVPARRAQQ